MSDVTYSSAADPGEDVYADSYETFDGTVYNLAGGDWD